jgi:hypothetical protein
MNLDVHALLEGARNPDGGWGSRQGQTSEAEPTALAALALDDDDARGWLGARQRDDGAFAIDAGPYTNDSATSLCALALGSGPACERALDHVERHRARPASSSPAIPVDGSVGWPWASDTASWVEPTARALWALRILRPASTAIGDAVALLRDRECVGGGWNYGNRVVLGEELPPFGETTAVALIGLRGIDDTLERRGLSVLEHLSRIESGGGLTLATALVALRLHGASRAASTVERTLADLVRRTGLLGDVVAIAWSALATGDRLPGGEG